MKKINTLKEYENVKDFYYIDELGYVWSDFTGKLKKISQQSKTGGYLVCCLKTKEDKKIYPRVHRLVALAYVKNLDSKIYVNHIDENRTNNSVDNLEWVTPKENNLHSLSKKVYVYNLDGEHIKTYSYSRECVDDGFNQGHVCECARGNERTHKKHIFSYKPLTKEDIVQRLSKTFYIAGKRHEQLYKRSE